MSIDVVVTNLTSPVILFFVLGAVATRVRSDLAFPEQVGRVLALYLLIAIGFKGGAQLRADGLDGGMVIALLVALVLGFTIPIVAYVLLRRATRVESLDAASVAAHYGSVSVVTFVAAAALLSQIGVEWEAFLVALLAVMESPAIIVGILMARRCRSHTIAATGGAVVPGSTFRFHEALTNSSVLVLLGSTAIGAVSGPEGARDLEGFLVAPFMGVLAIFLLDMGIVAARRFGEFRALGPSLLAFGIYMPLIGGTLGVLAGTLAGLSVGGATLLGTLAGSASYIAAPAAMRLAVPEANPSISLTLSLGITFPFNICVGIPVFYLLARIIGG